MLVVALAANVVKGLATGLREGFQPLVHQVLPGMLGKFKEKKLTVVTALREAVDAVYLTVRAVCVCVCVCVCMSVYACMLCVSTMYVCVHASTYIHTYCANVCRTVFPLVLYFYSVHTLMV